MLSSMVGGLILCPDTSVTILSLRQENPDQDCTDEKHKRRIDDHSRCDGSGPRNPAHWKPDGLDLPFDFDEAASGVDPSPDEKWNR